MRPRPVQGLVMRGRATIASAAAVLAMVPEAKALLTGTERDRLDRLRRDDDRDGFLAAHALVRLCAAQLFGVSSILTLDQSCAACGGPHGPARLRELPEAGVSMSHAGGVVAVAVVPGEVGIDVEPVARAAGAAEYLTHIAALSERRELAGVSDPGAALLMLWVRKEALVKLGVATLDGMADLDLAGLPLAPPRDGQHRRLRWGAYSLVDLVHTSPAAIGAVVSQCEVDIVPLSEVRATPA